MFTFNISFYCFEGWNIFRYFRNTGFYFWIIFDFSDFPDVKAKVKKMPGIIEKNILWNSNYSWLKAFFYS